MLKRIGYKTRTWEYGWIDWTITGNAFFFEAFSNFLIVRFFCFQEILFLLLNSYTSACGWNYRCLCFVYFSHSLNIINYSIDPLPNLQIPFGEYFFAFFLHQTLFRHLFPSLTSSNLVITLPNHSLFFASPISSPLPANLSPSFPWQKHLLNHTIEPSKWAVNDGP